MKLFFVARTLQVAWYNVDHLTIETTEASHSGQLHTLGKREPRTRIEATLVSVSTASMPVRGFVGSNPTASATCYSNYSDWKYEQVSKTLQISRRIIYTISATICAMDVEKPRAYCYSACRKIE